MIGGMEKYLSEKKEKFTIETKKKGYKKKYEELKWLKVRICDSITYKHR
jgi:hypothetical protein